VSERAARWVLGAVIAALVVAAAATDLPGRSGRQFWSDSATYYAMAWSLVADLDLRYQPEDLARVKREYPSGPQGIFLKRTSGGLIWDASAGFPWLRRGEGEVYYAKPLVYPVVAAPAVGLIGTRGFLLVNALSFGVALTLGYVALRRQASPARALAPTLVVFLATVTPLYLFWIHPEIFNMALVTAGLVAWRAGRPTLSALLLGVATYLKPPNLFLALPLGVEPLLTAAAGPFWRRVVESARRGVWLALPVLLLFGVTTAVTGEWNYQGGERKTFLNKFPHEPGITFGNAGQWMTTDHLGPLVEGRDEERHTRRTGPLRAPGEIRDSFVWNLAYFWVGRFGGVLPYFMPLALAVLLFLAVGPRDRAGWLALASLVVSWLFYIWMIPDNWYGGGGTVGNRYFLNLLPLALFLVPRGREWLVAGGGLLAGAVFLGPVLAGPIRHSLRPGEHATRAAFRLFPAELTMLNDLSVCTEPWRKKRPVGDTEGDPWRHWPADPAAYYVYFLDDGAYPLEGPKDETGFWLRAGERGEVVIRALEPVRRMTVQVTGGPVGDDVTVAVGGGEERLKVAPGETRSATLATRPGFAYYDTFLHVVRFRSRAASAPPAPDGRRLGAFVRITLEVDRRPRKAP
jgi:hypothetical protein